MKFSILVKFFSQKTVFFMVLSALFLATGDGAEGQEQSSKTPLEEGKFFRIGGGVSGEYTTLSARLKQDFTPYGQANFNHSHHMQRNLQIAPFIEFGAFIGRQWYLGLITSWHYSDTKDSSHFFLRGRYSVVGEFKLKSYVSSLVKIGYWPWDTMMFYGVMGPAYARWSHKTKQLFDGNPVGSFDVSKGSLGFSFGGGAEFPVTQNMAVSVDYIHTLYRSTKSRQVINISDQDFLGAIVVRSREVAKTVQPSHGVLSLKIAYFF